MFTPPVEGVNFLHFNIPKSTYFDRFSLNAVLKESSQIPNNKGVSAIFNRYPLNLDVIRLG